MINNLVKSLVSGLVSGLVSKLTAITRTFINLDPIANAYYEIAAPITFAGDFEIEVEFSSTRLSTNMHLIGALSENRYEILFSSSNNIILYDSSINVQIASVSGLSYLDGKLHKAKATRVGGLQSLFVDGVLLGSSNQTINNPEVDVLGSRERAYNYFDGIIANAKFTDKSGASDIVTTFRLDNSPAAENYTYSTELLDNNAFPDNANARQYLVSSKGWIITDGGAA